MTNAERSAMVVTKILAHVYENGLQESVLDQDTISLDEGDKPFFSESFKWLVSEGLIRVSTMKGASGGVFVVINPVLTSRGFEILGQKLQYKGETVTLDRAVKNASDEGGFVTGIGDFLGGFLGGFTKSMSS